MTRCPQSSPAGGHRPALLAFLVLLCPAALRGAESRIWVPAKINGQAVKLAWDTGASTSVLFRETAARLGLRVTNPPPTTEVAPGTVPLGRTEKCKLTVWDHTEQTELAVVEWPAGTRTEAEGLLGWPALSENIIRFDATTREVELLDSVPKETGNWLGFNLRTNADILMLEVPARSDGLLGVAVDTGSECGASLDPAIWREWTNSHPRRARTLDAYLMPGAGLVVGEQTWADKVSLGRLTLTGIPLREANRAEMAFAGPRFGAVLGLAALRRMDLVVDGRKGVAYVRPVTTPPEPYSHNRIGAVFTPVNVQRDNDLVADVLNASPAYEAGIRTGDILQKIDNLDVTAWRSDPAVMPLSRFFEQTPGTRIKLTLKRGEKSYQATVLLRDLIGPKHEADQ